MEAACAAFHDKTILASFVSRVTTASAGYLSPTSVASCQWSTVVVRSLLLGAMRRLRKQSVWTLPGMPVSDGEEWPSARPVPSFGFQSSQYPPCRVCSKLAHPSAVGPAGCSTGWGHEPTAIWSSYYAGRYLARTSWWWSFLARRSDASTRFPQRARSLGSSRLCLSLVLTLKRCSIY